MGANTRVPKTIVVSMDGKVIRRRVRLLGLFLIGGFHLALSSTATAALCSDTLRRFTFTEYLMGVDARIVVYAPNQEIAENSCSAAFSRIAELDSMMSDYRRDSELMRLSDKAGGPAVPVSRELFKVLKRAQEVAQRSRGLFDVTIGPLVQLWRTARKTGVLPTPEEIEKARALVGWQKVTLDDRYQTVKLAVPGMRLDFGAIAKGYADDEAQNVLRKFDIKSALVEMGGDIVVSDAPPNSKGWVIRVPNAEGNRIAVDMSFANRAISTSGDTEQFVVIGGVRYSHVVNPITGYALTEGVQATIIASDGLTADPVSTALTLLSDRDRPKFMKYYPGTKTYVRIVHDEKKAIKGHEIRRTAGK